MAVIEPKHPHSGISVPGNKGIKLHRSIIIGRPVEDCFMFWRNFENLPRFMEHVISVTPVSETVSHWTVKGPAGRKVEWDAEIINEHKNELIAWRSLENSEVANAGSVRFEPTADGFGTELVVSLEYLPPAGKLGAWVAKLFGEDPSQQIEDDLRRFKMIMETGAVPSKEG